mgnify:CR=1 FL=1
MNDSSSSPIILKIESEGSSGNLKKSSAKNPVISFYLNNSRREVTESKFKNGSSLI